MGSNPFFLQRSRRDSLPKPRLTGQARIHRRNRRFTPRPIPRISPAPSPALSPRTPPASRRPTLLLIPPSPRRQSTMISLRTFPPCRPHTARRLSRQRSRRLSLRLSLPVSFALLCFALLCFALLCFALLIQPPQALPWPLLCFCIACPTHHAPHPHAPTYPL